MCIRDRPLALDELSKALVLGEHGKKSTGKALIRFFCSPCKPTKPNGMRTRNMPDDDPGKWNEFRTYAAVSYTHLDVYKRQD